MNARALAVLTASLFAMGTAVAGAAETPRPLHTLAPKKTIPKPPGHINSTVKKSAATHATPKPANGPSYWRLTILGDGSVHTQRTRFPTKALCESYAASLIQAAPAANGSRKPSFITKCQLATPNQQPTPRAHQGM